MIRFIAAIDRKHGIAKQNVIPWHIPEDEALFDSETKKHGGHVLTGSVTFKVTYLGVPLADRHNYILTRATKPITGARVINDLATFLPEFDNKNLWISGGAGVFQSVLDLGYGDELLITHVDADFGCDRFFPSYEKDFKLAQQSEPREQNGFRFTYSKYVRK